LAPSWHQVEQILSYCGDPKPIQDIMHFVQWKDRTKFRIKYITPFLDLELLEMTQPDKPNSSKQQYLLTEKGKAFLMILKARLVD
jgi:ATP-dependent DNA helicase RecG